MVKILTLVFTLIFAQNLLAQQITGKVSDAAGQPLIGVSVQVKGAASGTTSDVDGNFRLPGVPADAVLVFSYVGYATQEASLEGRSNLQITLSENIELLEQVVVIGYGVQKKKDVTTAVATVGEKDIRDRPMVSAAEALQGKAAGVQVTQPSGKPGGDIAVRVRGATSVLAGNEPLYVVDGVPTTDIRGLNPADIETMSVLKDASSASIYGARAANGVVLITTKRGKEGESRVQLSAYTGVSNIRKTIETLTTKQYRALIDEIAPGSLDPSWTPYTDWQDEVFGWGKNQSVQLGFLGGNEKTRYMVSANYLNNEGIAKPARFDRYSVRLNLDNQANRWLKIGTNVNLLRSRTKDTPDNASSGRGGVIMSALNTPPFQQIYKSDGSGEYDPNPFQPSWEHPIAYMFGPNQEATDTRLFGNFNAEATIFKGFSLKTNVGTDFNAHQWDYYLDPFRTGFGRSQRGFGQADKSNTYAWLWENTANYRTSFGKNNLSLLAGSSAQKSRWSQSFMTGYDFPEDTKVQTLNAANDEVGTTDVQEWSIVSFFGRVMYDFDSKYLLTASIRRDGSSKLANPWGTMPSASAGWRISSEPFFPKLDALDDLKIRVGWGKNGNVDGLSNYAKFGLIRYFRRTPTNPLSGPGSYLATYGNPDLRWETTTQTNLGIDLSMWNGRMVFAADAYLKKTDDLLLDVQLTSSLSPSFIQTNAGALKNKGIEFNLSTVNLTNSALTWRTDANISFNRNEVTRLDLSKVYYYGKIYSNNQEVAIVREGLPLGSFFGYVADGVDPETGDMIFRDVNQNGILDPGDRTVIGNGNPKFTYGLTNSLGWRRFSLDFFLQGSQGNDIFNATRVDLEGMFDSKNQSTAVLRRWTPENRNTDIPRAVGGGRTDNVRNSTRFIEDGSYLRLKQVTLTYSFNPKRLERWNISRFSVYATGQNLLTFTKYSGFDPEVNAFGQSAVELGVDYGTYPQARTATVGLNVEF